MRGAYLVEVVVRVGVVRQVGARQHRQVSGVALQRAALPPAAGDAPHRARAPRSSRAPHHSAGFLLIPVVALSFLL